jgi:glyoxylase-like metal-dependent hydrolase (beta-lactamase superfamily II)
MRIKMQPMGYTQTNCYIVDHNGKQLIIDPGMGATSWVLDNVTHPVAILNTHGHYDHVWSNAELQEKLRVPVYIHEDDAFMLQQCPLNPQAPKSEADKLITKEGKLDIEGFNVVFRHFPGHTPGCGIFEIGDVWFSGDFLFEGSIGRWDFPFSDGRAMLKSLQKAMRIKEDFTLYPGHGMHTTLKREQKNLPGWIRYVEQTI